MSPMFCLNIFNDAVESSGWGSDVVAKDPYPRSSRKDSIEKLYRTVQSSHMTGSQMATRDADEQRQYDEEQHRRAEEHRQQARAEEQRQLYQQLDDAREKEFDGDDASCVCLEDLEEHKDLEDEGPV